MTTETKSILLVDDDQDFIFQQQTQLEAAGYTVVTANDAKTARKVAEDTQPDLAIVDLMMEERDAGFTLCYFLKKSRPELPIIMCTGVSNEAGMDFEAASDDERAWVKADAMVRKPVRFEQLQREINRLTA